MPWSKSRNSESVDLGSVSKSQAALSGPEGDGKEHDLQYWLDSGFLTLPAGTPVPVPAPARGAEPVAPRPAAR
ncbi:MAG: hypothetical protein QOI15_213 [Pseudonocardiales bacterium]|jgi:hypothetical protein|nr:hypothetical protein [Pseudonocardiales bacterium]MDT4919311.1 hypothetical protein [Pseudonocardiales bacterium]MDT4942157.1 hypothetical protein [Pseudonocardiales bacterium]